VKPAGGPFLFLLFVAGCTGSSETAAQSLQVRRLLEDDRFEWVTVGTENTRIHFPSGSYAETQDTLLPARAEGSRRTVLEKLSESDYPDPLHLFYVDSRGDMERLTGRPVTGYSYYDDRAIVVVFNDRWRAFERHELTHTVTLGTWASPAGPAVVEGLATYVDGTCGGYENGRVMRTISDRESMLSLDELVRGFRQQDDLIAYLQAASIIDFMVYRLGPEAVGLLWDQGLQASHALLRRSADVFQEELETWLSSRYDPVPAGAWESIRAEGCGIDARPAG
jgi:uncharacterized protein (DUF2164 family)